MRYVLPVAITEANLVASNIIDSLPNAPSAVSYPAWAAGSTYTSGNQVIHAHPSSSNPGGTPRYVSLFTAIFSSLANYEPWKKYWTGAGALPGFSKWAIAASAFAPSENLFPDKPAGSVEIYDAGKAYSVGAVVGYISGGTGAFYTSLVANNLGNTPSSSPTQWRQSTADSYAVWSGATTYALGDRITLLFGTRGSVYRSLQAGNLNNDPARSPLWWDYEGDAYKAYAAGTTYALKDIVYDPTTLHNFESQAAGNVGNALTDPAKWLDMGAANRWAMFDLVNSSQTIAADEIDVTFSLGSPADGLGLLNMVANDVQVIVTEGVTEIYNETFDLNDNSFITDWRHYFFDPISYKADLVLLDLPFSLTAEVRVIIRNPGGLAKCGTLVPGLMTTIGGTSFGVSTGTLSFSKKDTDEFGNAVLVKRPSSKRGSFKVWIRNDQKDAVEQRLSELDAVPVLYIGTDEYAATWIYGFYRSFDVILEHARDSSCRIDIEGLI